MQARFDEDGSTVVRGLLKPEEFEHWCRKAKNFKSHTYMSDPQCPGSPAQYNGMNELHDILLPIMEEKTNIGLYKTYNYFRIYNKGTILENHTDRDACEISITLNLGGDDWEISIKNYNGDTHTTTLKPGDAMIYRGCDLEHWRPGTFQGNQLVQVFCHYVDKKGSRAWAKDDKLFRNQDGELQENDHL